MSSQVAVHVCYKFVANFTLTFGTMRSDHDIRLRDASEIADFASKWTKCRVFFNHVINEKFFLSKRLRTQVTKHLWTIGTMVIRNVHNEQ